MMSEIIVKGDCELAFASLVGIAEKTNFLSRFLMGEPTAGSREISKSDAVNSGFV